MSESNQPLELILTNIEQLDKEMTSHQNNCFKCSEAPCKVWESMVKTWNFHYLVLTRATKNHVIELPNYE